ncbi:MAG: hypothetical protein ACE5D8_04105 [Fidelibacterota bacterium]
MTNNKNLIIMFFFLLGSWVIAQGVPSLELTINEEKLNLTDAEAAGETDITYFPGDTIRYTIRAVNAGTGTMVNPEVVDPIPAGVRYVTGTAGGDNARVLFSIDMGKTFHSWPVQYTIRNEKGKNINKTATADMITHIKWEITESLSPGEERSLLFDVVVK